MAAAGPVDRAGESIWRPRDNPLLSKIAQDSRAARICGRVPGLRRLVRPGSHPPVWLLAILLPTMAFLASLFSILCGAATLKVLLCSGSQACAAADQKNATMVYVGYLYEANAALFYLFFSWLWIYLYLRFLDTAKKVIAELANRHRLRTTDRTESVLDCVARMRRGRWARVLLMVAILASIYTVVGTEFNPRLDDRPPHERVGDFWQLTFGYVQATAMPGYEGKTLGDLQKTYGRRVDNINFLNAMPEAARQNETVVSITESASDRKGGPRRPVERVFFWIFLPLAVATETIFVPFAVWTVVQVVFVLWILYRALTAKEYPLRWKIDRAGEVRDAKLQLEKLYGAIKHLVYVALTAQVASIAANAGKGSGRYFNGFFAHTVPVLIGQNAVTSVAALIALPLLVFMVLFEWGTPAAKQKSTTQAAKDAFQAVKSFGVSASWLLAPMLIHNPDNLKKVNSGYDHLRHAADAVDGCVHWLFHWI